MSVVKTRISRAAVKNKIIDYLMIALGMPEPQGLLEAVKGPFEVLYNVR